MLDAILWPRLPLDPDVLQRRRLTAQHEYRSSLVGDHLSRRRGQSLEFSELGQYVLGDDLRHVDWRSSARHGFDDSRHWQVRRFHSEEMLTVAISLDMHATLDGPEGMPKRTIALWLAEAVALMTLVQGDRVLLHGLYGGPIRPPDVLSGARARHHIRPVLARLQPPTRLAALEPWRRTRRTASPESPGLNLRSFLPSLGPTTVWIVVTDGYLPESARDELTASIARARAGMRWVILVELDSWPYERDLVGTGARRIAGPAVAQPLRELEISPHYLDEVGATIDTHVRPLRAAAGTKLRWAWPLTADASASAFFCTVFERERVFLDLFRRDA